MTLILDLSLTDDNQAQVKLNEQLLGTFDPQLLLEQNPFANTATNLERYGDDLYAALHGEQWPSDQLDRPAPQIEATLAIRTSEPRLHAIPWECLRINQRWAIEDTLLVRLVPITDHTRQALSQAQPDYTKPYRLVVQRCEPLLWEQQETTIQLDPLEAVRHINRLAQDLQQYNPSLPLIWHELAPTTNAMIRHIPVNRDIVLYHFTGHGDWYAGKPVLLFDHGDGRADPTDFSKLSQRMNQRVQLVFLNACHSADTQGIQASLALSISQGGIPVVIGMQGQVEDSHAQQWASCFYPALAQGNNPLVALWQARIAMLDLERYNPIAWMQPAIYMIDGYSWQSSNFIAHDPLAIVQFPRPALEQLQVAQLGFIGRRIELIEIARLLSQHRVVTIRGSGGIGKTALVAALAQRVYWQFRNGIYAYSFANQAMPQLMAVLRWCAGWLNLNIDPNWQETELCQQVLQQLRNHNNHNYLLIIDNYETILWDLGRQHEGMEHWQFQQESSPSVEQEPISKQKREIANSIHMFWQMIANEGIKLVFTTRHSPVRLLDVSEQVYPPQFGQLQGLTQADGLALFKQWCGRTAQRNPPPDQPTIKLLLEKLGTSPLAIQLAARRWATLTNPQSATFLADLQNHLAAAYVDDGSLHQRTLAINVRLSVEALAPAMQIALFQLSLLENPVIWDLNAAAIWGLKAETAEDKRSIKTYLNELEAPSLIQIVDDAQGIFAFQPAILQILRHLQTQVPFQDLLLEPIQQSKIYYGQFAQSMTNSFYSQHEKSVMDTLAIKILPDLLAGKQYLAAEQAEKVEYQIHKIQGHFRIKTLIEEVINNVLIAMTQNNLSIQDAIFQAIPYASEPYNVLLNAEEIAFALPLLGSIYSDDYKQAVMLYSFAHIYRIRSNLSDAQQAYTKCLAIYQALENQPGRAATLHELAYIHRVRGDYAEAEDLYQQSLAIKTSLGDQQGRAATLHELANIHRVRGNYAEAKDLYQQSLAIKASLGDQQGRAATLHELAYIHRSLGELDEAERLYQESLDINATLGNRQGRAATLHELAYLFVIGGNFQEAELMYGESLEIYDSLGDRQGRSTILHALAYIFTMRGKFPEAERLYQESLTIKDELNDYQGRAATLHQLAYIFTVRGKYAEAADLYRQSLAIKDDIGDIHGKASTLVMLGQLQIQQGQAVGKKLIEQAYDIFLQLGAVREAEQTKTILNQPKQLPLSEQITEWLAGDRAQTTFVDLLAQVCNTVVDVIKANDQAARHELATQLETLATISDLPLDEAQLFVQTLQAWLQSTNEQWQPLIPQLNQRWQAVIQAIIQAIHPN